jgi:hypothetical protein
MTDAGPQEKLLIGPLLRDCVVVALRHWVVFIVTAVALACAFIVDTLLTARCVLSPACFPTPLFRATSTPIDDAMWAAYKVSAWLICGLALRYVLASEARKHGVAAAAPPAKPLHGLGRSILYLICMSVPGYALEPAYRFLMPDLDLAGMRDLGIAIAVYGAHSILLVCIWTYIDARFALFTASRAGGEGWGFAASWKGMQGNHRKLLLLFVIIESTTTLVYWLLPDISSWTFGLRSATSELESLIEVPQGTLFFRLPDLLQLAVFRAGMVLLISGAFFAVYRSHIAASPETRAAVFD